MPDKVQFLDLANDAFSELGSKVGEISEIIKKGDEQADTRKGAIQTIHEMCDALQLACDLVSKELSTSIIDFSNLRNANEDALRGFFQRAAFKFSDASLRTLLHEGKVCSELHALGDRFTQPFSDVTTSGVSVWQNVMTFFSRSNSMSTALAGLYEGEMDYLRSLSDFLDDVRDDAEKATAIDWGNLEALQNSGYALTDKMRSKRQVLRVQISALKVTADDCIKLLH